MKKVLIVFGIILGIGLVLAAIGVIVYVTHDKNVDETYTERVITEERTVTALELEIASDHVKILPSEDGKFKAVCQESDTYVYETSFNGGKLKLEQKSKKKIWLGWTKSQTHELVVYLPETVKGLKINLASGTLENKIPDLALDSLKVDIASGSVKAGRITVNGDADFEMASGSTTIDGIVANKLTLDASSGSYNIKNVQATKMETEIVSGSLTASDIKVGKFEFDLTSGKISADRVTAEEIEGDATSGTVKIGVAAPLSDYSIKGKAASGTIVIKSSGSTVVSGKKVETGTGAKKVEAECASGKIEIDFE